MKEAIHLWLHESARLPGILACGVRHADHSGFAQGFSPVFPQAALENAVRCVADTFMVLQLNRLPTERLRWVYDKAFLYATRRKDGSVLILATARDPESCPPETVEALFQEFHSLRPSLLA
jgi:hypothetical protein